MIRGAINRIIEIAAPNVIESNGYKYSDKNLNLVRQPHCETLCFKTLKGFADTIKYEPPYERLIISVDATKVLAYGPVCTTDEQRNIPYKASADIREFEFGRYMDYETMIIALNSRFVKTDELAALVSLLGHITEESATTMSDDGVSQTVIAKSGTVLKSNVTINPIVNLKPFRTFIEVEQPESKFLIRVKNGQAALFEADGGAWELEARKNVAEFLKKEFDGIVGVIVVE